MTTILGLRAGGKSYLASDRLIVQRDSRISAMQPKIYRWGRFLLGVSGDLRLHNLISKVDSADRNQADAIEIATTIRERMKQDGWNVDPDPGAHNFRAAVIIAGSDGVWKGCGAFGLSEMGEGEACAAGSGQEHAIAATDTALRLGQSSVEAMRIGMASAIKYDIYTGGEPEVWEVDEEGARVVDKLATLDEGYRRFYAGVLKKAGIAPEPIKAGDSVALAGAGNVPPWAVGGPR